MFDRAPQDNELRRVMDAAFPDWRTDQTLIGTFSGK